MEPSSDTAAFESLGDKVNYRGCAGQMLLLLSVSALGVLVAHGLGVGVWEALPWTRAKPLPDFLVFPSPRDHRR
jgi:hypothetical protein